MATTGSTIGGGKESAATAKRHISRLRLEQRMDGWWITGIPDASCPENGPYTTKAEAMEEKRGHERFWERWYREGGE